LPFCKERDSSLVFGFGFWVWGDSVRKEWYWGNSSNDFMRRAADVHPIIPDFVFRGRHARFRQPWLALVAFHTSATGAGTHG
jgi:hypothetical protein